MSYIHAIVLGALQGLTELFPISSLGHSVLLPHLLGWQIDEGSNSFLIFLVATHLATSLVLFAFFWQDWMRIAVGMFHSLKDRKIAKDNVYAKLGWLLVVATIPAGLLGVLFQEKLKTLFATPIPVAIALALNGVLLLTIELIIKKKKHSEASLSVAMIADLTWWQSVKIGLYQCLALIPGFSRTGSTLGAGLIEELGHTNAAYFSFLLATPIIFAAAVLKLPELIGQASPSDLYTLVAGSISAALFAYISVRFLSKYFKTKTLTPFGIYCLAMGLACVVYFIH